MMQEDPHSDFPPHEEPSPEDGRIDDDTAKDLPSNRRTAEAQTREKRLWIVLAALVGLIFFGTLLSETPAAPGDGSAADAGGLELRFQARYVLGVDRSLGAFVAAFGDQNLESQLLDPLRQMAETPGARLSIVPVIAEVAGVEPARQELAALAANEDLDEATRTDLELMRRIYGAAEGEPADGQAGEESDGRASDEADEPAPAALSQAERDTLVEHRGWFARLALVHGKDDDDPERREILAQATRTAIFLIILAGVILAAAGAGLVLLLVAVALYRKGKWRPLYEPERGEATLPRRLPYLETLTVFIALSIGISALAVAVLPGLTGPISLIVSMSAGLALFWPFLRGENPADVRRALGWQRGKGVLFELGCGLVGYLAGAPILLLAMLVSVGLAQFVERLPYHPLIEEISGAGPGQILFVYFLACVWAPVVEEALFRGGFYHYLRGRMGFLAAGLSISVIFAVIHPQGILGVPPLVALALILAALREWRGSLIAPMGVHAVHNGLAVTAMFMLMG